MLLGCCAPLDQADEVSAAGFDYIEPPITATLSPTDDAWTAPDWSALPLPILAYNLFLPGDWNLLGEGADDRRTVAYADRACERAAASGARVLVLGSGKARTLADDAPRDRATEHFVTLLSQMGERAAAHGVRIVVEPLRRAETNFITTVTESWPLVRRAASAGAGQLVDFYHVAQEGEDLTPLLASELRIDHVHIADPVTRDAPRVGDPYYREAFSQLKAFGYDGTVSCECRWEDRRAQAPQVIAFLREAWEAAG